MKNVLPAMPIRKRQYALLLLFCGSAVLCAAQSAPPQHVVVDGKLSEWANPLPNYDKQTMLYYDVHNDQSFLYLALKRDKWGGKIKAAGRIVFEFVPLQGDSSRLRITYPTTTTGDATDMWNYLEVLPVNGHAADTVTIYNDYGIQAGGRYWSYETPSEKKERASFSQDAPQKVITLGADGELAIPLKLLPASSNGYTIKVILSGDAARPGVKDLLDILRSLPEDVKGPLTDEVVVTSLSITYRLK